MNITLPADLEMIVREKVERGEYDSADAFIGAAIQRLVDEETAEEAGGEEICTRVEAAEAEIDRGDFVEYDEETIYDLAKDIHNRGLKRLAAERESSGTRG